MEILVLWVWFSLVFLHLIPYPGTAKRCSSTEGTMFNPIPGRQCLLLNLTEFCIIVTVFLLLGPQPSLMWQWQLIEFCICPLDFVWLCKPISKDNLTTVCCCTHPPVLPSCFSWSLHDIFPCAETFPTQFRALGGGCLPCTRPPTGITDNIEPYIALSSCFPHRQGPIYNEEMPVEWTNARTNKQIIDMRINPHKNMKLTLFCFPLKLVSSLGRRDSNVDADQNISF